MEQTVKTELYVSRYWLLLILSWSSHSDWQIAELPEVTLGHVAELSWQQFTIWMSKSEYLVVANIVEGGPFYVNKMIEVRLLREENPKNLLFDKELTTCKLRLHTV